MLARFSKEDPAHLSLSRLLVEDVDGHDAEGVVVLDGAGGAVRVERALGHLREDHVERVGAALIHRGQDVLKMPCMFPFDIYWSSH